MFVFGHVKFFGYKQMLFQLKNLEFFISDFIGLNRTSLTGMIILIKNLKKRGRSNNLGQTITILLFLLHVTYILCFRYQIIHHVHTYYYNSSNIKTELY